MSISQYPQNSGSIKTVVYYSSASTTKAVSLEKAAYLAKSITPSPVIIDGQTVTDSSESTVLILATTSNIKFLNNINFTTSSRIPGNITNHEKYNDFNYIISGSVMYVQQGTLDSSFTISSGLTISSTGIHGLGPANTSSAFFSSQNRGFFSAGPVTLLANNGNVSYTFETFGITFSSFRGSIPLYYSTRTDQIFFFPQSDAVYAADRSESGPTITYGTTTYSVALSLPPVYSEPIFDDKRRSIILHYVRYATQGVEFPIAETRQESWIEGIGVTTTQSNITFTTAKFLASYGRNPTGTTPATAIRAGFTDGTIGTVDNASLAMTYTTIADFPGLHVLNVGYANNTWLAQFSSGPFNSPIGFAISTNGSNWIPYTTSQPTLNGVLNNEFTFLSSGTLNFSTDGVNIITGSTVPGSPSRVLYSNNRYLAVYSNNQVRLSTDKQNWSGLITFASTQTHGFSAGKDSFFAIGLSSTRTFTGYFSTNGVTWTRRDTDGSNNHGSLSVRDLYYSDELNYFIAYYADPNSIPTHRIVSANPEIFNIRYEQYSPTQTWSTGNRPSESLYGKILPGIVLGTARKSHSIAIPTISTTLNSSRYIGLRYSFVISSRTSGGEAFVYTTMSFFVGMAPSRSNDGSGYLGRIDRLSTSNTKAALNIHKITFGGSQLLYSVNLATTSFDRQREAIRSKIYTVNPATLDNRATNTAAEYIYAAVDTGSSSGGEFVLFSTDLGKNWSSSLYNTQSGTRQVFTDSESYIYTGLGQSPGATLIFNQNSNLSNSQGFAISLEKTAKIQEV